MPLELNIKLPPKEVMDAMIKLMANMKSRMEAVKKIQQQWQQGQIEVLSGQHVQRLSQTTNMMRRMPSFFHKFESILRRSIDRMVMTLGPKARFFIRTLTIPAEIFSNLSTVVGLARFAGFAAGGPVGVMIAIGYASYKAIRWVWSKAMALMEAANQDRIQSIISGTTIGGLRAFRALGWKLPADPRLFTIISMIREMQTSTEALVVYNFLGVQKDQDAIRTMFQTLIKAQQFLQQFPDKPLLAAEKFQLPISPETALRIKTMTPLELQQLAVQIVRLQGTLNIIEKDQINISEFLIARKILLETIYVNFQKILVNSGMADALFTISHWMNGIIGKAQEQQSKPKSVVSKPATDPVKDFVNWLQTEAGGRVKRLHHQFDELNAKLNEYITKFKNALRYLESFSPISAAHAEAFKARAEDHPGRAAFAASIRRASRAPISPAQDKKAEPPTKPPHVPRRLGPKEPGGPKAPPRHLGPTAPPPRVPVPPFRKPGGPRPAAAAARVEEPPPQPTTERVFIPPTIPPGYGGMVADRLKQDGVNLPPAVETKIRNGQQLTQDDLKSISKADLEKTNKFVVSQGYPPLYRDETRQPPPKQRPAAPGEAPRVPLPPVKDIHGLPPAQPTQPSIRVGPQGPQIPLPRIQDPRGVPEKARPVPPSTSANPRGAPAAIPLGPYQYPRTPTEVPSGTPGWSPAATNSVENALVADRAQLKAEGEANPEVKEQAFRAMRNEQGANPLGVQMVLESMVTRARIRGHSLEQVSRSTKVPGGYYDNAPTSGTVTQNRQVYEDAWNNVFNKGSNASNFATGNASNQPGNPLADRRSAEQGGYLATQNNEYFFHPNMDEKRDLAAWYAYRDRMSAGAAGKNTPWAPPPRQVQQSDIDRQLSTKVPVAPSPGRVEAPSGDTKAFVVHYTGSNNGSAADVVNGWRNETGARANLGTQFIVDRQGVWHDVQKEFGWNHMQHVKTDEILPQYKNQGINNKNIVGVEIMTDSHGNVTPDQLKTVKEHVDQDYNTVPIYSHSELVGNARGFKGGDEGTPEAIDLRKSRGQSGGPGDQTPASPSGSRPPMYAFRGIEGRFDADAFRKYATDRGYEPVILSTIGRDGAAKELKAENDKRGGGPFWLYGYSKGASAVDSVLGDETLKGKATGATVIAPAAGTGLNNVNNFPNVSLYPDKSSGDIPARGDGFYVGESHPQAQSRANEPAANDVVEDHDSLVRYHVDQGYPTSGSSAATGGQEANLGRMSPLYLQRAKNVREQLKEENKASSGGEQTGPYSTFRDPSLGVNSGSSGWSYRSMHGSTTTADWSGVPAYGTPEYEHFRQVMEANGFTNPYLPGGPGYKGEALAKKEWNHWQLTNQLAMTEEQQRIRDEAMRTGNYEPLWRAMGATGRTGVQAPQGQPTETTQPDFATMPERSRMRPTPAVPYLASPFSSSDPNWGKPGVYKPWIHDHPAENIKVENRSSKDVVESKPRRGRPLIHHDDDQSSSMGGGGGASVADHPGQSATAL